MKTGIVASMTILGAVSFVTVPGAVAQNARDTGQQELKVLQTVGEYIRSQIDPDGVTKFEGRSANISDSRTFELESKWDTATLNVLETSLGGASVELAAALSCEPSETECEMTNADSFVLLSRPRITGKRAQVRALVFEEDLDATRYTLHRAALEIALHESGDGWTIAEVRVLSIQP